MKLPFATPGQLRGKHVLGINERNGDYVQRYNKRSHYPFVDDKIRTKRLLQEANIDVPRLDAVIESEREVRGLIEDLRERDKGFVIKPAKGSAGNGVLVIVETAANAHGDRLFRTPSGKLLHEAAIRHHVSNVLSGIYSFGDRRDRAILEELVQPAPPFTDVSWEGIPDVRILVLQGYPVAAMARLPTLQSQGRANLHQGAVGVGIDIASGVFEGGEYHGRYVTEHPDTLKPLSGHQIPQWNEILELAARCHDLTGIGFLGVDVVIDRSRGPLVLELNARPGISIQLANRFGIGARLRAAAQWSRANEPAEKRVARVTGGAFA